MAAFFSSIIYTSTKKKEEKQMVEEIVIDKTQKIELLISSVEDLKKTTVRIHVAYGVVLFIGFVVFAI